MVFTADDVGYAKVNIINNRRKMIEIASVFPDDNRVSQIARLIAAMAAHHIVPLDDAVV